MTKAYSSLEDNGGRCESCNRPETKHQGQTTYPVMLGGGLGMGTMWLCPTCIVVARARDALQGKPKPGHPAWTPLEAFTALVDLLNTVPMPTGGLFRELGSAWEKMGDEERKGAWDLLRGLWHRPLDPEVTPDP